MRNKQRPFGHTPLLGVFLSLLTLVLCPPIAAGDVLAPEISPETQDNLLKLRCAIEKHVGSRLEAADAATMDGMSRRMLHQFDEDRDGQLERAELKSLLKSIGIGNGLTRGCWADAILKHGDVDKSKRLSPEELDRLLNFLANIRPRSNPSQT